MDTVIAPSMHRCAPQPTTFRTKELEHWKATVSKEIIELDAATEHRREFAGEVVMARFHDSIVADVRSTAHRVMRSREIVSRDRRRYCKIVWQMAGCTQFEQKRRSATVHAGEWAVYDTSVPYSFEICDNARFLVLLLPFEELIDFGPDVDRIMGMALRTRGDVDVARVALSGVLFGGASVEEEGQRALQDFVLALMSNAIRRAGHTGKDAALRVTRKIELAQAYIEKNLGALKLTPEVVAQACGMSRRSLYEAFSTLALTPCVYIQRRRLERACEFLGNPSATCTIAEVAYELGFADAAHFSRLFNERYGMSPSQWRKGGRAN